MADHLPHLLGGEIVEVLLQQHRGSEDERERGPQLVGDRAQIGVLDRVLLPEELPCVPFAVERPFQLEAAVLQRLLRPAQLVHVDQEPVHPHEHEDEQRRTADADDRRVDRPAAERLHDDDHRRRHRCDREEADPKPKRGMV